ncbi:MAG TPA: hypothetical protein VK428_14900 [Acidimicrobiales bacterium]|nr:hypothetical protein [Acidimicrobiales bacterium]
MPGMGSGSSPTSPIVSAFHTALLQQLLVVLVIVAVVWAVWNQIRNARYRRWAATGVLPASAAPNYRPAEPPARRILRLGFAFLWVLDGLLQLQSGMPLGMPGQVLRPAASSSPAWVRDTVGFGAALWSHHPVLAAASVVWIQLGIGALLLVSPRGWLSRSAGLASAGWAMVVWVFGEAFGGVFGSGSSWLFGTPGAALLYAAAGLLIALPERTWSPATGRRVLRCAGLFLLGMAVLQAWPGRGFWQGAGRGSSSGALLGMVRQMAETNQPAALVRVLHAFAHLDAAHGWAVNLVLVALLGAIGLSLSTLAGPAIRPALFAAATLCLADWVFVQDLGFLGGVGTDPNSMVPTAILLASGYVALAGAAATRTAAGAARFWAQPAGTTVFACAGDAGNAGNIGGPWWCRASLGQLTRLAGTVAALGVVVLGVLPMSWAAIR